MKESPPSMAREGAQVIGSKKTSLCPQCAHRGHVSELGTRGFVLPPRGGWPPASRASASIPAGGHSHQPSHTWRPTLIAGAPLPRTLPALSRYTLTLMTRPSLPPFQALLQSWDQRESCGRPLWATEAALFLFQIDV